MTTQPYLKEDEHNGSEAAILASLDDFREAQLRLENRWLHQQIEAMKRLTRWPTPRCNCELCASKN